MLASADADPPPLWEGIPFAGGELRVDAHRPGRALDFCLTSFAVPVVREHLAAAIQTLVQGDVQRLPLLVRGQSGFEVLNVLRVIECVDEARSVFLKWTRTDHRADLAGQYRSISTMHLLPQALPDDAHIFRIKDWPMGLIVSERIKLTMEAAGCLGAKFVDVT